MYALGRAVVFLIQKFIGYADGNMNFKVINVF